MRIVGGAQVTAHDAQRAGDGRIAPGKRLIVRMQGAQFALVILQQLIHARSHRLISTCRDSPICIIEEARKRNVSLNNIARMRRQEMLFRRWHSTFVHSLSILIDLF